MFHQGLMSMIEGPRYRRQQSRRWEYGARRFRLRAFPQVTPVLRGKQNTKCSRCWKKWNSSRSSCSNFCKGGTKQSQRRKSMRITCYCMVGLRSHRSYSTFSLVNAKKTQMTSNFSLRRPQMNSRLLIIRLSYRNIKSKHKTVSVRRSIQTFEL